MFVKVKDNQELLRDNDSKAIVNSDREAYEKYIAKKKQNDQTEERLSALESDINNIKSNMDLILKLLQEKGN